MLNYMELLKNAKEEELMQAVKKIERIKEVEDTYKTASLWYPGQHKEKRKDKIIFAINNNIISYEYSYKEGAFHCYFSKSVKCNHSRITMKDIDALERVLFTYINENPFVM